MQSQELPELPPGWQVHYASRSFWSNAWIYFVGAGGLVFVALVGFVLAIISRRTTPMTLHASSTLPMILAVGLIMTGITLLRSPRMVTITPEALRVRFTRSEEVLPWETIAWTKNEQQAMTGRQILVIYGTDGKVLIRLASNLEGWSALVDSIKQRLAAAPSPAAASVQWRKSRRTAVVLLLAAAVFLTGAVFLAWSAYDEHRSTKLLESQGITGAGIVARKFIAPDGHTHRIEFRVAEAGADAPLHNVEIEPQFWQILGTDAQVPIKTVPGHPEIAQLLVGEIKDPFLKTSPLMNVLLPIGLFGMSIAFLVGAILGFKGIDINTDPATGKLRIERLPR